MSRSALLSLFLLLSSATTTSAAQPAPVPALGQYGRQVHSTRLALDRIRSSGRWSAVGPVRRRLAGLGRVRLPGRGVLRTDLPLLGKQLAPRESSVRLVSTRLDALDAALHKNRAAPADPVVLSRLDAVLRDSRFHPKCMPLACALQWAADTLLRLIRPLQVPSFGVASGTSWLFGVLFLLLVVAGAVLLARGALRRAVADVAERPLADSEPGSAAAGDRARAYADRGDYRSALRYLFLSTLLSLQEIGLIELRPSLTNREYVRTARPAGPGGQLAMSRLAELVDQFDRLWYGHQEVTPEVYARCRALAAEIVQAARERAA